MRILQVHNRYREPGGEDRVVSLDAAVLTGAGHELRSFEVENPVTPVSSAVTLTRAPWNRKQAGRIDRVVRDWKPDVAHVHNTWYSLSPAVIRGLVKAGIPTVVSLHNCRPFCVNADFFRDGKVCTDCAGRMPWRGVVHACYRNSRPLSAVAATTASFHRKLGTWEEAGVLLAPSQWLKNVYVASGFASEKIRVSPWFTEDPGPRSCSPSASADIVYLGRLQESKGVLQLIRAWRAAGPKTGEMRLRIIGDGILRKEVEALAGDGIELTPWLERADLNDVLLGSRAIVYPSVGHESFGMVPIEGFASGMPVLTSDRGDLPALVGDLDPALSVRPEDQSGWSKALARFTDDAYVDRLGAAARRLFESRFSPVMGLKRLEDAYATAGDVAASGRAVS